jgi:pimeloyl-ACP methyl ester carboxylesterase
LKTHTLETAGATIVYDIQGPLPPADGRPPLFMIGQPMDASGFRTLASSFPDRTVITYDPRGLGRSTRSDGRVENMPTVQAEDVHAVISVLGVGPVEMFASSGGAVAALALVAAYPHDVSVLVAHEPPHTSVLPDADAAERAIARFREAYAARGWGAGMAAFIAMTSWQGEFTEEYFAQPTPDPARFGLPAHDDGSRDDPLLSDRSRAVSSYRPDFDALAAAPTRIVIAVGEESLGTFTGRTSVATAERLGQQATVFPSHHGGFVGGDSRYAGQPEPSRRSCARSSPRTTDPALGAASQEPQRMDSAQTWTSHTGKDRSRDARVIHPFLHPFRSVRGRPLPTAGNRSPRFLACFRQKPAESDRPRSTAHPPAKNS